MSRFTASRERDSKTESAGTPDTLYIRQHQRRDQILTGDNQPPSAWSCTRPQQDWKHLNSMNIPEGLAHVYVMLCIELSRPRIATLWLNGGGTLANYLRLEFVLWKRGTGDTDDSIDSTITHDVVNLPQIQHLLWIKLDSLTLWKPPCASFTSWHGVWKYSVTAAVNRVRLNESLSPSPSYENIESVSSMVSGALVIGERLY